MPKNNLEFMTFVCNYWPIFVIDIFVSFFSQEGVNELMESKGGKKKSSSSKSLLYEAPLDYTIEDVRPHGGIKKFRSAAYSNVSSYFNSFDKWKH